MLNRQGRCAAVARTAGVVTVALAMAAPAWAQFGGLKKKVKAATAPEASRAQPGGGDQGGTVVLTADVVDRLVIGLEAGEAERQAAAKADTPYGRYHRQLAAYEGAKPKCQAGQQTFATRAAADQKMMDQYDALVKRMVEAQTRGDQRLTAIYSDSALAMQDPSCTVKEPQRPEGYYEAQREIDSRAEDRSIEKSGFSRAEFSQARERAEAVLRGGTAPGDLSASEKSAVTSRAKELKPLLGIHDVPAVSPAKAAATSAPTPPPAQPAADMPAGASGMSACMGRNAQKHEKEIRALGERAQAAQQAGNTAALMAIADTLQRLQMAGCTGSW
jgi:hypothetical protein